MKHYSQYQALVDLAVNWKQKSLRVLKDEFPSRAKEMNLEAAGLWMDYGKSWCDGEVLDLLIQMAQEAKIEDWRERMFGGEKINFTEKRAVLHTALRHQGSDELWVDGQNVRELVSRELAKMEEFVNKVREGVWRGYTGREITDVVNIGIGGSDLGPKMVTKALADYQHPRMKFHFVSNVDGAHLVKIVKDLDPETTMFIIASKTFTTAETMMNAYSARDWFMGKTQNQGNVEAHFVAVSTNLEAVTNFGIDRANAFGFWDWVGGRYSVWSAVGLSVMLAIGVDNFREFLAGAAVMDEHFRSAPLERNMPVILALLGIWYRNFMNLTSYGVMPYAQDLEFLPAYLEQLEMESNGKCVNRDGERIDYATAPVIWGEPGTNGQHAFFQALHQGTDIVPLDMILTANSNNAIGEHQQALMANCLAQMEALAYGKSEEEVVNELLSQGMDEGSARKLALYKTFEGNRPSVLILMNKLTPGNLGALLALYEHKVFVQGVIWEINSFDQMGVELGKVLAKGFAQRLSDNELTDNSAVEKIRQWRS